jgi:CNT family concentrative nucleoside transporter
VLLRGFIGIFALLAIAWLLSSNRRHFPVRIVVGGLVLQWLLAHAVLRTRTGEAVFDAAAQVVVAILDGADAGARFVFGELAGGNPAVPWPAIAGIKILTTIIVVATLAEVGYHYGILQRVVGLLAAIMRRTMGLGGAESLVGAANVFLGQTEAPLLVLPYIAGMTTSELMALMTTGFATVAAGVMAVYVTILSAAEVQSGVHTARHLMTACLMSAPAAFVIGKIMVPELRTPDEQPQVGLAAQSQTRSLVDAMTRGAGQGMTLAINVIAMLIAFIAIVAVADMALVAVGRLSIMAPVLRVLQLEQLDLDGLMGLIFWPIAWLLGVESGDCRVFASLLGKAMATNELIAYGDLAEAARSQSLSPRSIVMATYCLCGFANLSSIGIQVGGIGSLVPERRNDLIRLGPRAMLGGAMACWMTGCIAGMLVQEY